MSRATRYARIVEYYTDKINKGNLKEGQKLPTEMEIGLLFNVSRITVRRALDELVQSGFVYRLQGKGSYISTEKTDMQLNSLVGFSQEMKMLGRVPSTKVISLDIMKPTNNIATALKLSFEQMVYRLVRLRSADGLPMAVERVHLPFYLFPGLEHEKLDTSLYEVLGTKYGCKIHKGAQSIQAGIVTGNDAELLQIHPRGVGLYIFRTTYDKSDIPIEFVESVYRGDKYKFNVTLYR